MGVQAYQGSFSVGRDATLDITTSKGLFRIGIITDFNLKPKYKSIESHGLDGINRTAHLPAGGDGTISFDRGDSQVGDFFAALENDFYSGIALQAGTITQTITEVSGAVTQYRYVGVMLKLDDPGTWKGDDKVAGKIGVTFSRKIKVA